MQISLRCTAALTAVLACGIAVASALAQGQDYPNKPVRVIVPIAPGGIADIVSRLFAQKVGEGGKHTIIVENRTGGAGVPGTDAVAKAPADGYTFLTGHHGVLSILPHLQKLPYDPVKDFVPVVNMIMVPNILTIHPSIPAKNLKELVAYAKANPGKLTYASQGVGTTGHIGGELLKLATGIDIAHVPYRGAAPAAQDLIAGHVSMMFDVVPLALAAIRDNRVRALGVATKERVAVLPDVPTMIEQGSNVELSAWFGLIAPAGTPKAAIAWINQEANKALSTPDVRERFGKTGGVLVLGSPESFGAHIASETRKYGDVIKKANIKIN
ncbi:MAG: tripartite tricarboxylate transporter substrate binding protein [Alphaproteobacteria bacterium]|nr:tripartite tricarboxylate transporter substrate binding protein [Alphaproteobacteria bacterium]